MGRVVIGMDPHKRSATIEVIDEREQVLAKGRYGTDSDGYQQMLTAGRAAPQTRPSGTAGHSVAVRGGKRSAAAGCGHSVRDWPAGAWFVCAISSSNPIPLSRVLFAARCVRVGRPAQHVRPPPCMTCGSNATSHSGYTGPR